jgi:hypothetical protein
MEEGSEGSEGSEVAEDSEVLEVSDAADVSEAADGSDGSDEWDGSEGSGWFADPDVEGQERYFDGTEWTPETRPADPDAPLAHLPEHTGELQRALAAATADIDDVEDRLGSLFDRAEQQGERGGRARKQAAAEAGRAAEGKALAESVDQGGSDSGAEAAPGSGAASVGAREDDDDAFADLDEALASEEPEKVKKGFFRRRP